MQIQTSDAFGRPVTMDIAVWYPAAGPEGPFSYVLAKGEVATKLAENGKPLAGPYPLIIFSHGAVGSGLGAAFLAETLARHGYVVAAPDHTDEVTGARIDPKKNPPQKGLLKYVFKVRDVYLDKKAQEFRPKLSYRPYQVKSSIDLLLAENKNPPSDFYGTLDENKIGVIGHSFGAWTAFTAAGAVPQYADLRIQAAVILSPAVKISMFSDQELKNLRIPVMMMFGEKEARHGRGDDHAVFYNRMTCPRYLLEIEGAGHDSFAMGSGKDYRSLREFVFADTGRGAITRYTRAFFDYYLKGNPEARRQLSLRGAGVTRYIFDA